MKIAFSTSGHSMCDLLDRRFGRAARFLIFDTVTHTETLIDNTQNLNSAQGAGIQAAQHIVNSGAEAIITGHTGPKAFKVMQVAGIPVYYTTATALNDALTAFQAGSLVAATGADVEGHWL